MASWRTLAVSLARAVTNQQPELARQYATRVLDRDAAAGAAELGFHKGIVRDGVFTSASGLSGVMTNHTGKLTPATDVQQVDVVVYGYFVPEAGAVGGPVGPRWVIVEVHEQGQLT